MAFSFTPKCWLLVSFLISIAVFCCKSELEENDPAQMVAKALLCFNEKSIYSSCEEAFRLNEGGNIDVPFEKTDEYCNGPCPKETQLVLNCVDNILSSFLFYNKATIQDVRATLSAGCGYTSERGNFNVAEHMQAEANHAYRVPHQMYSYVAVWMIIGFGFLI